MAGSRETTASIRVVLFRRYPIRFILKIHALTELRPLFLYEKFPTSTPGLNGGNAEFYGVQGRLALTDQWSVVLNKFGFVSFHPNETVPGLIESGTGFAEVSIGPKWTFYRNQQTRTVAAFGTNFNFAVGDSHVYQNVGSLSIDPYLTFGQSFGKTSYGSFNFLGQTGFDVSVDSQRSSYFHSSLHLDYDVANLNKFYPTVELNYFYYTHKGGTNNFSFEGGDLFNFGSSNLTSKDTLTMATGMRYKFNEHYQIGGYFEFPLTSQKMLNDYRIGLDFIIRY